MKNVFASQLTRRVGFIILTGIIVILGAAIRLVPAPGFPTNISDSTLTPYYFDKFDRLTQQGTFPSNDVWEFAPSVHPENAPPGLAYTSLLPYRIWEQSNPTIDTLYFANLFPILAFILWVFVSILIFRTWLGKKRGVLLLFLSILAFTPVAISLTTVANYTQETIGVFLLFLSLYLLFAIVKPSRFYYVVSIFVVTALVLTWQQFPILYFGVLPILAIQLWSREFEAAKRISMVLLLSLLVSELIIRLLIGNDYSPFSMLKEFVLGFWLSWQKNSDFLAAMVRGNWRQVSSAEFYQLYGPLTLLMVLVGAVTALKRPGQARSLAVFLFTIIALYSVLRFEKEKNLSFGLLLFPAIVGIENVLEWRQTISRQTLRRMVGSMRQFVGKRAGFLVGVTIVMLAIGGWFFLNSLPQGIALLTRRFPPRPDLSASTSRNDDGTIDVTIRLTNKGGTTFFSDQLWFGLSSGLHLEVGNGDIVRLVASSPTSPVTWQHYAAYPYARWGDYYFVEVKFQQLKTDEYGEVRLTVKPNPGSAEKPTVYFRGWMPETSCILDYKRLPSDDPRARDLTESEGEACLYRTLTNEAIGQPVCPVRVSAARWRLQNFRCQVLQL